MKRLTAMLLMLALTLLACAGCSGGGVETPPVALTLLPVDEMLPEGVTPLGFADANRLLVLRDGAEWRSQLGMVDLPTGRIIPLVHPDTGKTSDQRLFHAALSTRRTVMGGTRYAVVTGQVGTILVDYATGSVSLASFQADGITPWDSLLAYDASGAVSLWDPASGETRSAKVSGYGTLMAVYPQDDGLLLLFRGADVAAEEGGEPLCAPVAVFTDRGLKVLRTEKPGVMRCSGPNSLQTAQAGDALLLTVGGNVLMRDEERRYTMLLNDGEKLSMTSSDASAENRSLLSASGAWLAGVSKDGKQALICSLNDNALYTLDLTTLTFTEGTTPEGVGDDVHWPGGEYALAGGRLWRVADQNAESGEAEGAEADAEATAEPAAE